MELTSVKLYVLLAALLLVVQPVLATERTLGYGDTPVHDAIPQGGFQAYVVSLKQGDVLEVKLSETSGIRVDFYLTNYTAYLAYSRAIPDHPLDFYFVGGGTSLDNVSSIEYSYSAIKGDKMVVIADNSNRTDHGARSLGGADVQGKFTVREYIWNFRTIAIVAGVGFVFFLMIAFALRSKRARQRVSGKQESSLQPKRRFVLRRKGLQEKRGQAVHPKAVPLKKPASSAPLNKLASQSTAVKPSQNAQHPVNKGNQNPHRKPLSPKKGMRGR